VFEYIDAFYNRQRRHSHHHHHPHQVSRKPGQVRRSALASAQMRRRKCRRLT
jgi:hypothetical protein